MYGDRIAVFRFSFTIELYGTVHSCLYIYVHTTLAFFFVLTWLFLRLHYIRFISLTLSVFVLCFEVVCSCDVGFFLSSCIRMFSAVSEFVSGLNVTDILTVNYLLFFGSSSLSSTIPCLLVSLPVVLATSILVDDVSLIASAMTAPPINLANMGLPYFTPPSQSSSSLLGCMCLCLSYVGKYECLISLWVSICECLVCFVCVVMYFTVLESINTFSPIFFFPLPHTTATLLYI